MSQLSNPLENSIVCQAMVREDVLSTKPAAGPPNRGRLTGNSERWSEPVMRGVKGGNSDPWGRFLVT
jgi:hypothetical protein